MQNNIRLDLCQELRRLLDQWHTLEVCPTATSRDFDRLSVKIKQITSMLEDMDKVAR